MLSEIEKTGTFWGGGKESSETLAQERNEKDMELVFREQVRRLLGDTEQEAKDVFHFYTGVLRGKRASFSVRINPDVQILRPGMLHGMQRPKIILGEFGGGPKDIVPEFHGKLRHEAFFPSLGPVETTYLKEKEELQMKVQLLEHQLQCDRSHLQLFRVGAGSLLISLLSLAFWRITGVGAPFHPIFAAVVMPVSAGLMTMAFLIKKYRKSENKPEHIA
jgi:hypothetical protein